MTSTGCLTFTTAMRVSANDELELVLAQIVGLSRDNCARDMAWIRDGLRDRATIDRLRTVSAGRPL